MLHFILMLEMIVVL